jgi:hypothetical protein
MAGLLLKMTRILRLFLSVSGLNCSQNCAVVSYCCSAAALYRSRTFVLDAVVLPHTWRSALHEFISSSKRLATSAHPAVITQLRNEIVTGMVQFLT